MSIYTKHRNRPQMSQADREEIVSIVLEALKEHEKRRETCPMGVNTDTARELMSFADTWRTSRKYMIGGVITVAVSSLLTALWFGLKAAVKGV